MEWTKLTELKEENLWRGTVFRFPAFYPFEPVVDFMLFLDSKSESGFSLVCTTGYKAGHFEGSLPKEALSTGKVHAINKNWLLENWSKWIYPETPVSEVKVISNYPQEIGKNA